MNKIIQRSKETLEKFLEYELFETKHLSRKATRKTIDDSGVTIEYKFTSNKATLGVMPYIIFFTLNIGLNIGINILSSWLYDKLKNKDVKLRIDKTKVEIDEEKIKELLIKLMKDKDDDNNDDNDD